MKIRLCRRIFSCLVAILPVAVTVPSSPAMAGDEGRLRGEIDMGLQLIDIDGRSYKYGEYTGADRDGIYFVGGADLHYSRGNRYHLDLKADRLGYDSRSIRLDTGLYGGYRLSLEYGEIPHLLSNSSKTPFDGAGNSRLTLPPGFVTASSTSGMTTLSSNLTDVNLELDRKTWTMGFSTPVGGGLDFKLRFKNEQKDGVKSMGGPLGIHGGFTSSVVLPEPVDYSTNEVTASIAYNGKSANAEFTYHLSVFDNDNESLTWDVPFLKYGPASTVVSPTYPATARTSLPPNNRYQNFGVSGGVNLGESARISAIAEYGIMEQDADLLPYTINPASTVGTPLPRRTAEAEIDIRHLELALWTRPLNRLDLNARYRYYETDNRTPSDLFRRVVNDTGNQVATTDSAAAYNLPYDLRQNKINIDASCRIATGATLKIGYEFDDKKRSYREVSETKENTYSAKLTARPTSASTLALHYSYGERRGDDYEESRLFDALHSQDHINSLAANVRFDNHPDAGKFDIADRDRTKYGANVSLSGMKNIVVGLYYDHRDDDYRKSVFGLKSSEGDAFTMDMTLTPADFATVYIFYTRERLSSSMDSRSYDGNSPVPVKAAQSSDPNRNWSMKQDDRNDTVGAGLDFLLVSRRLKLGVDYTLERSTTEIGLTAGSSLATPVAMPDLATLRHRVDAKASYALSRDKTIGVGYQYENYSSDDWATDGMSFTTLTRVLPLSLSVADYESHAVFFTFTYRID